MRRPKRRPGHVPWPGRRMPTPGHTRAMPETMTNHHPRPPTVFCPDKGLAFFLLDLRGTNRTKAPVASIPSPPSRTGLRMGEGGGGVQNLCQGGSAACGTSDSHATVDPADPCTAGGALFVAAVSRWSWSMARRRRRQWCHSLCRWHALPTRWADRPRAHARMQAPGPRSGCSTVPLLPARPLCAVCTGDDTTSLP